MARQMVGDDDEVFRIRLVEKEREWDDELRRWVDTDETRTRFFGPYNSIGAARGQRTSLGYVDYWDPETEEKVRMMRSGVVSCRIQKAHTTWEDVN
ncbi:hypothetical protein ACIQMR_35375 [Streptomyces sp. NPDC091376]|uniref:hypothetical protein n=1 Tax=Streptomyces sp. NPDC091376 TaxID=3365994 RepID=UPI0037FB74EC